MRWPVSIALVAGLTAALPGCKANPRKDLIEAELRVKDADLRELRAELERTDAYNKYLQRELVNLSQVSPAVASPADAISPATVCSLVLGRQTSGIDDDNVPGDEALQVVLEPRDAQNHAIKIPGTVQVQALEITPEGTKRPISAWQIDPETLRKSWRTGLLSTGYYLVLPWKSCPCTAKVRVVAQFVSEDQRLFEADRDVVVRLIPPGMRPAGVVEQDLPPVPPATTQPMLPAPQEGPALPAPKEWEPRKTEDNPDGQPAESVPPNPIDTDTDAALPDPNRPLKGVVELLKPIVRDD